MSVDQLDIQQVRQMSAILQAQEFLATVRDKCFEKCITNPGRSLSANDQTCLQRCVDRYGESTSRKPIGLSKEKIAEQNRQLVQHVPTRNTTSAKKRTAQATTQTLNSQIADPPN